MKLQTAVFAICLLAACGQDASQSTTSAEATPTTQSVAETEAAAALPALGPGEVYVTAVCTVQTAQRVTQYALVENIPDARDPEVLGPALLALRQQWRMHIGTEQAYCMGREGDEVQMEIEQLTRDANARGGSIERVEWTPG